MKLFKKDIKWPGKDIGKLSFKAVLFDPTGLVEVVGETSYQDELKVIAGKLDDRGVSSSTTHTAVLLPEPSNPHDANAVRVVIASAGVVGYLSREDAIAYRAVIDKLAKEGQIVACEASLKGGFLLDGPKKKERAAIGVVLRLGTPGQMMAEL